MSLRLAKTSVQRSSGRVSGVHLSCDFMSDLLSSRISSGSTLRCQQSSPQGKQIRERRQHTYMVTVLEQSAEANLTEPKHALDRAEDMLYPCAHLGFHSVRLADALRPLRRKAWLVRSRAIGATCARTSP